MKFQDHDLYGHIRNCALFYYYEPHTEQYRATAACIVHKRHQAHVKEKVGR